MHFGGDLRQTLHSQETAGIRELMQTSKYMRLCLDMKLKVCDYFECVVKKITNFCSSIYRVRQM